MKIKTSEDYEIYEKALSGLNYPDGMHSWINHEGEADWETGDATEENIIEFSKENDIKVDEIGSYLRKKLDEKMEGVEQELSVKQFEEEEEACEIVRKAQEEDEKDVELQIKLEEYIVLGNKNPYSENYGIDYYITKRDNFKETPLCETYGDYGQLRDHDEGFCTEDDHYEVEAWTYHDGSNFKSIIINNSDVGLEYEELDEDTALKILAEIPDTPYIEKATETVETENYEFHYSRYQDNPWICEISE